MKKDQVILEKFGKETLKVKAGTHNPFTGKNTYKSEKKMTVAEAYQYDLGTHWYAESKSVEINFDEDLSGHTMKLKNEALTEELRRTFKEIEEKEKKEIKRKENERKEKKMKIKKENPEEYAMGLLKELKKHRFIEYVKEKKWDIKKVNGLIREHSEKKGKYIPEIKKIAKMKCKVEEDIVWHEMCPDDVTKFSVEGFAFTEDGIYIPIKETVEKQQILKQGALIYVLSYRENFKGRYIYEYIKM